MCMKAVQAEGKTAALNGLVTRVFSIYAVPLQLGYGSLCTHTLENDLDKAINKINIIKFQASCMHLLHLLCGKLRAHKACLQHTLGQCLSSMCQGKELVKHLSCRLNRLLSSWGSSFIWKSDWQINWSFRAGVLGRHFLENKTKWACHYKENSRLYLLPMITLKLSSEN